MTMKYFRFDWKTLGFALALAVASFALNGCALLKELRKGGDECLEEICYGEGEVGPEGGIVEFDGMRLEIPEGALEEYVYITIDALGFDPLPGMTKHSPVYNFNPAGQQFLKPVTVIIEADSPADGLAVLWSLPGSTDEFEALSTKRDGASFTAETTHFSFAFLGFPTISIVSRRGREAAVRAILSISKVRTGRGPSARCSKRSRAWPSVT